MPIIRFNPWNNNIFRPFWDEEEWPNIAVREGLNVYEENNQVVVKAALPGVSEDKIDITYEDGVLTISGQTHEKEEQKEKNRIVHKMEMASSFHYTTYLPRPIDTTKLEAKVEAGVVTITAPIAEAAKAKKIPVIKANK